MKTKRLLTVCYFILNSAICLSSHAQGTAFTYQGQLQDNGALAGGTYNLTFTLFTTNTGGVAVAGPVTNNNVIVSNGLFTVLIDFGPGAWNGQTNWLELGVATNGVSSFTTLTPRQQLTPVPYAIYAESVPATGISGTLLDAQLNHSAVTVNPGPGLSGGGRVALGNTIILTNTGVLAVTGNADITAATVGGAVTLGDTATSADTASTLVKRDGSGGFSAASLTLDGTLTLPDLTLGSPDAIWSGDLVLLYNDDNGNFASGLSAGYFGTTGQGNTAVGVQALYFNIGGSYNTAVGNDALTYNQSGEQNTANGYQALFSNTSGSGNAADGFQALFSNTSGSGNTADGFQALFFNTSGVNNTALGAGTLEFNTNGFYNTAVGSGALNVNTSGAGNTATGLGALGANTSGSANTADGTFALSSNTNGVDNAAFGYNALYLNTSGSENTAIGVNSLYFNTAGSNNTANGANALLSNTNGSYNTAIGEESLDNLTTGSNNIAVGYLAGGNITTGSGNIDIGNGGLSADANIIRIGSGQIQTYIAGVLLPPPPVLLQTNFIDGHRYTNTYGWPLMVNATVVLNTAGVVGSANETLCIQASPAVGGFTNVCAISTIAASAPLHYTNYLGGFVPTNAIYWFTNLSTGGGNSAGVIGGQLKYP